MIVVAVASGTSADGLDVGVVDLVVDSAGDVACEVITALTRPWPDGLRDEVLALLPPATTTAEAVCALDQRVGQAVADVVTDVVQDLPSRPELVVSPGQTVYHDVRRGQCLGTLQLGQPAWIAERTGLPVVSDLRARDVAASGHGAPLASTLDALWLRGDVPRAALNLGGIANVTVVSAGDQDVLAWDTGPANCLIDVAAARASGGALTYDDGGRIALSGAVRRDLLERLLEHPHFRGAPPTSTGREAFSAAYLDTVLADVAVQNPADPADPVDLVTTLTELTAVTVARALAAYDLVEVVASGGGVLNPALMGRLRTHLGDTALVVSDELGMPSASKEVVMWALLGFLSWHGAVGTNGATGSVADRILGRFSPGDAPLRLPEPLSSPVRRLRILTPSRRTS